MSIVGFVIRLVRLLLVVVSSRRTAAISAFAGLMFLTQGQQIDIAGFHFTALRLILLAGIARAISRNELRSMPNNPIDKLVLAFAAAAAVLYTIRIGTAAALVYQLGRTYDILLSYFLFRALIRNPQEAKDCIDAIASLMIPFAALMAFEAFTGHNVFSAFGGIQEAPEIRDGHFRCQGSFRSPITAGTLGATFLPLFAGLNSRGKPKVRSIAGTAACCIVVIAARSSGPLLSVCAGIGGLCLWKWRRYTKWFRRGAYFGLIILHLIMKAPVWFLFARISDLVGGGGWHRSELIDQAVNHFGSWWLMGTSDTGDWMPTQLENSGTADLTNQFVSAGVGGGLLALLLFILLIVKSFSVLGAALKGIAGNDLKRERLLWALGAALFTTVINFLSVSYFDQIEAVFYFLLACIAAAVFGEFVVTATEMPSSAPLTSSSLS